MTTHMAKNTSKNSTLSLRLSLETKTKLENEAILENRPASFLADFAINNYLEQKSLKRKYLETLLDEADKSELVSEKKFMNWFKNYCDDKKATFPNPDTFLKK